jgi:hypothetical protein
MNGGPGDKSEPLPFEFLGIDLNTEQVVMTDGTMLPIIEAYDRFGDEIEDLETEEITYVCCGNPEKGYFTIELPKMVSPTLH